MTDNERRETAAAPRVYRPRLSFYKPNPKGTGCALQLEVHPAHDLTDGSIMARFANQLTVGDRRGPNPTYPHFDWENALTVKLEFSDLAKMLQVFRGECEALEDGKGLYHRSPKGLTRIGLKHLIEPICGYMFEVSRTSSDGQNETRAAHLLIAPHEATGLVAALEGSLSVICFGLPVVIERDTSAYRQAVRGMHDASAA